MLNITALCPEAQNFDLMYQHVKALKEGKSVDKPIYNHVTGLLDPAEKIESPDVSSLWCGFLSGCFGGCHPVACESSARESGRGM